MDADKKEEFEALLQWVASWPRPKLDYSQMPVSALLSVGFYSRLLTHQACYMLLLRICAVLYPLVPEPIFRRGQLSLAEILQWSSDLTVRTLREAYCTYPHQGLVALVADLKIEERFLLNEEARRLEDKRLTCEFIRLDWAGENRTKEVARLLRVDKITSYRPWEQDAKDIQQTAWVKALEFWSQPGDAPEASPPLPPLPFPADQLLPSEREFWEGPMAKGWEIGRGAFLREAIPVFAGEKETIRGKVRDSLRNEWETIKRRKTISAGQEEFPDDPRESVRADWDWSESAEKSRQKEIAAQLHSGVGSLDPLAGLEVERAYRIARKRWKKRGRILLDELRAGHTMQQAAAAAGISDRTASNYLHTLRRALS